jgi:hypothetical protein
MSNRISGLFPLYNHPVLTYYFKGACAMIWISLAFRIPALFIPREDRDVTDYVTRHLFKGLPEEKPMIHLTDEARDHIREKGGSIYLLDTKPVGLCCGRVAFEPQLTIGVPAKQEGYVRDVINDIQVYIPKRFSVPYPLTIDVKKHFGRKVLHLNGWRLI